MHDDFGPVRVPEDEVDYRKLLELLVGERHFNIPVVAFGELFKAGLRERRWGGHRMGGNE